MSPKLARLAPLFLSATLFVSTPCFAVNKETIQLQTQVQQLGDAVARLQQSNDERMGVLKDLVQQSADQTNKMAASVEAVQRQLQTQNEAGGGKLEQVSGQVQSMNDSLDEIKARLGRLEKLMQDVQSGQQQQNAGSATASGGSSGFGGSPALASPAPASASSPPASLGEGSALGASTPTRRGGKPSAAIAAPSTTDSSGGGGLTTGPGTAEASAPPIDQLYKTALGDYMAAKYGLAQSEFGDLTRAYPDNPLSGNAFFYQGEIEYRGARYGGAIKNYDTVLEKYPDSNKVPAAHLHKGQALIQLKQEDAGVREFRSLMQRFPNSPEALQARTRLNALGVTKAR